MPGRTATRPLLQTLARQLQQQSIHRQRPQHFSIMHNLRAIARSFEPHPFQRLPVASSAAPADWARLVRRAGSQAVVYVLFGLLVFFSSSFLAGRPLFPSPFLSTHSPLLRSFSPPPTRPPPPAPSSFSYPYPSLLDGIYHKPRLLTRRQTPQLLPRRPPHARVAIRRRRHARREGVKRSRYTGVARR